MGGASGGGGGTNTSLQSSSGADSRSGDTKATNTTGYQNFNFDAPGHSLLDIKDPVTAVVAIVALLIAGIVAVKFLHPKTP